MPDIYPSAATDSVKRGQFYDEAAYEEPANSAYDQYTEDQFPRMSIERRSNGLLKGAIWVLIIAIIGVGGYFAYPMVRGIFVASNQPAKAPPVIKADTNPVKVEPETQPQDNMSAPKDIFTKHANEDPKAAQMAPGVEQPVDVNAAAKSAAQSAPPSKPVVVPLVPGTGEPRLVKTVTVRADGTIIPEKSDPVLAAKTQPSAVKPVAVPPAAAATAGASAAALPPLPDKPVAESPDFTLEGGIPLPPERFGEAQPDLNLPLDAITTPIQTDPTPEAVEVPTPAAPAVVTPVATIPGKEFAVQFGAPETEAKGNELKARIEKQFASALTGGTMAVVKGDNNGKPVFRVRAVGYTRDEATAVCQQVTAAGGQCFVSKNN